MEMLMSYLQPYVRQVKSRNESRISPVDKIQNFLSEAKMDATKFEGNLLIAMGAKPTQAGSYNSDKESKELASTIVQQMVKAKINISKPSRSSGSAAKGVLSKLYKDFGVKSTEPKADISFGGQGVSVKSKEGAQLISAQGPEISAIVQHVVTNNKDAITAAGVVADGVPTALATAFAPENYYAGRAGESGIASKGVTYPTELAYREKNKSPDNPKGDLTADQKKEITAAKNELAANDKKLTRLIDGATAIDYANGARAFGITKDLAKNIELMFNLPAVRKAIILEAMTGDGKFTNKEAKATQVLSWGKTGVYSYKTVAEASANVSGYNFRISDRGSKSSSSIKKMGDMEELTGALTGRGGSLRIDILPPKLLPESMDTDDENYIDEIANDIAESHRTYLTENLEYVQELLLQEGLLDFVKTAASKVMDGINFLVNKVKTFVSNIGKWMVKMVKNTGYYLMAFNLKPQMSFKIK